MLDGHSQKRCSNPPAEQSHFNNGFSGGGEATPTGGWDTTTATPVVGDWNNDSFTAPALIDVEAATADAKDAGMWDSAMFEPGEQANSNVKW
jgi:hypothetical protein